MREGCLIAALHLMVCVPMVASSGIRGLEASGPAPEWATKLILFGQFVGDWECDVVQMKPDGSKINGTCEWALRLDFGREGDTGRLDRSV